MKDKKIRTTFQPGQISLYSTVQYSTVNETRQSDRYTRSYCIKIWTIIYLDTRYKSNPQVFMPQTSKKLEGHIASGKFVRPSVSPYTSVRPSVRPLFLMHRITSESCMLGF